MIRSRVGDADGFERFEPQPARIAATARAALAVGVVATVGHPVVHSQLQASANDLLLRRHDERRVNPKRALTFSAGLGRQIGEILERLDEFGATIGVARVVDGVHAQKDVERADRFGPGQRQLEKHRVPRGDVSDRNPDGDVFVGSILGNLELVGRQRAAAEGA